MATLTPASYAGMLLEMAGGSVATAQRHIPKALDARFAGEVYARLANVADEDDRAGR
jgi:hypothetical protein